MNLRNYSAVIFYLDHLMENIKNSSITNFFNPKSAINNSEIVLFFNHPPYFTKYT